MRSLLLALCFLGTPALAVRTFHAQQTFNIGAIPPPISCGADVMVQNISALEQRVCVSGQLMNRATQPYSPSGYSYRFLSQSTASSVSAVSVSGYTQCVRIPSLQAANFGLRNAAGGNCDTANGAIPFGLWLLDITVIEDRGAVMASADFEWYRGPNFLNGGRPF